MCLVVEALAHSTGTDIFLMRDNPEFILDMTLFDWSAVIQVGPYSKDIRALEI